LKQILTACGVEAGKDGVYEWDLKDVLDRVVTGRVKHEEEPWTNRDGRTVTTKKHKIENVSISMEK